jgi:hypothetical protein
MSRLGRGGVDPRNYATTTIELGRDPFGCEGRQFGLENTMTVQIAPKSTQHTGMAVSTQGSVAAWEMTFDLDGDESVHAAISIRLAGPPTHEEARQKALKILQVFLNDACEAAKKYQFSN